MLACELIELLQKKPNYNIILGVQGYKTVGDIDTEFLHCEISCITSENSHGIAIYIKMGVENGTF